MHGGGIDGMRRTIGLLLGMVVLAAGVLVAAPAAQAADSVYVYRNQGTGQCLLDSNIRGLVADTCYGSDDQRWVVHPWGDGTVRLGNVGTGRCINDSFSIGSISSEACNSSENQSWWVVYWADKTRRFQNQATGHCLDQTLDGGLRTWECNSGKNQSWYNHM